jgi:hypothetical protein
MKTYQATYNELQEIWTEIKLKRILDKNCPKEKINPIDTFKHITKTGIWHLTWRGKSFLTIKTMD